ncbi:MAG TPA: response regulator [Saprospiraceae bacterium]|nr:response regulator [Saprospiraceae bacterium]
MHKILVIEDNTDVRENIAEILELAGYNVSVAENGKIGVEQALLHKPDLILCDIMMPELDGFGVLRILSKNIATAGTPFIFLTAKAEKDDFRRGMGLGADDYITKPFDDVMLLDTIELRLKRSNRLRTSFDGTEQGLQHFFNEAKAQDNLLALTDNREIRKYEKRDTIFTEGQIARWLFFIVSGKVKSYRTNDIGKELITKVSTRGDFLGMIPLLQNTKYTDSAMALESCEIRLVPKEDFLKLVFSQKEVSANMIKALARQLEEAEQHLLHLAYDAVREKVAGSLVMLSDRYQRNGISRIPLLREDLAGLAGTAKETVIRTLSEFKEDGLIEIDGNDVVVKDLNALRKLSH